MIRDEAVDPHLGIHALAAADGPRIVQIAGPSQRTFVDELRPR